MKFDLKVLHVLNR